MSDTTVIPAKNGATVTIIYILYLVGLVVGLTSLIAVIMATSTRVAVPNGPSRITDSRSERSGSGCCMASSA